MQSLFCSPGLSSSSNALELMGSWDVLSWHNFFGWTPRPYGAGAGLGGLGATGVELEAEKVEEVMDVDLVESPKVAASGPSCFVEDEDEARVSCYKEPSHFSEFRIWRLLLMHWSKRTFRSAWRRIMTNSYVIPYRITTWSLCLSAEVASLQDILWALAAQDSTELGVRVQTIVSSSCNLFSLGFLMIVNEPVF